MYLLKYFYSAYPQRTIITFFGITLANILGGIGISALIPILEKLLSKENEDSKFITLIQDLTGINPSIENLIIFLVAAIILKSLIQASSNIYARFTVAKVTKDMRVKLLRSISKAEWKFYTNQPSGKIASSLMGEATATGQGYLTVIDMLSTCIQAIVYLAISLFISWQIVALSIITSLVMWFLLNNFIEINRKLGEKSVKISRLTISQLTDLIRNVKSLKAMGRESHSNTILESYTKKLKSISKKTAISNQALVASQEIITILAIVSGIYIAVEILKIPAESVIVLSILYIRSLKLTSKVQKLAQSYAKCISSFDGIMEIMTNATNNKENRGGTIKKILDSDIVINNLIFSHHNKLLFNRINLTIHHKKLNTIIGESGAGKTTLVDLICGIYTPDEGDISISGTPLREIDLSHWREQIGYVVQDNNLLNTTIKENVTLGDSQYTDETIKTALRKAHAMGFVNDLDNNINTLVGENGSKLSGGQRQRILIARAIVHSPTLLILDEATSALDNDTEISLSNIFKELSKEITIISISHRHTLKNISDHILEIHNNKLIEIK